MKRWVNKHIQHIFMAPTIIFVLALVTFPIVYTIRISMSTWTMGTAESIDFVGLHNYVDFLKDERFWNAFARTISYTLIAVGVEMVLGVAIALLISKIKKRTNIVRTVFLLPMVATPVAVGILWKLMYDPTIGVFNMILSALGLPTSSWLSSSGSVFSSLIIMDIWEWTPMIMLMVFAGISGLGDDMFESAKVDGANERQTIFKITLPLLAPTILMAVLLRMIDALKTFDQIYSTTSGGPGYSSENLNILSYRYAFEYFYMGKACALLMIFFLVVLAFALLYLVAKKWIERRYQ